MAPTRPGTEKTRWVRFVDEVNENLSRVQEACLATYTGFYCINQVLTAIFYCCENLNRRIYTPEKQSGQLRSSSSTSFSQIKANNNTDDDPDNANSQFSASSSADKLQSDYTDNVLDKLNTVRRLLGQLNPLNYRLEVLENIYSLIYLTSHDLKETDEAESDEEDELDQTNTACQANKTDLSIENDVNNSSMRSDYEVITAADLAPATTEDNDFSIYMGAEETRPAFKLGRRNSKTNTRSSRGSSFIQRRASNSANSCMLIFVLLFIYPLRNLL